MSSRRTLNPSTRDAGDNPNRGGSFRPRPCSAERAKVLYSRYLVAGCAVVFSKLRFNDNLRVELYPAR